MEPDGPTAGSGVRTALGVLAAVLLVGLLARSPATEADLGPTEPPTESPTPLPEEEPEPPRNTPVRVASLDPVTLVDLDPNLTELAEGWIASPAGSPLVLAEPTGDGGRLRVVGDGDADSWRTERIDRPADVAWVGIAGGTIAWVRIDGTIRIQVPGSTSANRTMALPRGADVLDARLLDAGRLAILTLPTGSTAPSILVLDIEAHVIAVERQLPDLPAPRLAATAWDVDAGRLFLVEGTLGHVVAVDLVDGSTTTVDLPLPTRRPRELLGQLHPTIAAAEGLVAVSGVEEVVEVGSRGDTVPRPYGVASTRPYGVAVFDADLTTRAHVDDGATTRAHPVGPDRILAVSQAGVARVLDAAGQEVGPLVAADPFHPVGSTVIDVLAAGSGGPSYLMACPTLVEGCTPAGATGPAEGTLQLLAVDPRSGRISGVRALGEGFEAFLSDGALLVTR